MRRPGYIPLQWKFIGIASVAIILFTSIFGLFAASRNEAVLYDSTEKQGKVLAQTVAALIINELIYEKLGLVEEGGLIDNYLQELYKRREMEYVYLAVLDSQNKVISHSDFREYGKSYSEKIFEFSDNTDVIVRQTNVSGIEGNVLEFAAPLAIGGKNWGVFLFTVTMDHVAREVRSMLLEIWAIAFTALFFGLGLIWFLSKRFIQPISTLAVAMKEVDAERSQELVPVKGRDELAQLAGNFNEMIVRLSLANDEMKMAHEKLLLSEKLATLGILSSSVAHRINNPLGGLQNCISMLKKRGDEEKFRQEYLDLMQEGIESIEQTISQLLWSAGKSRAESPQANVAEVLDTVLRFVDYRIRKAEVLFHADVPSDFVVPVSPHDLNQILVNLLINAIQAMPEGGELKVEAKRVNDEIALVVSDTGYGIESSEIEHIFDLFYTTKKVEEGTGLGLWMTYELVKRNKAEIQVDSQKGVGTVFTVIFPEVS